jgi:hypothetical protein
MNAAGTPGGLISLLSFLSNRRRRLTCRPHARPPPAAGPRRAHTAAPARPPRDACWPTPSPCPPPRPRRAPTAGPPPPRLPPPTTAATRADTTPKHLPERRRCPRSPPRAPPPPPTASPKRLRHPRRGIYVLELLNVNACECDC